jgi:hypothetical protein
MTALKQQPLVVPILRLLIAVNGVIWVLLAAVGLTRASSITSTMAFVYLLALTDAAVLLWLAWRLGSRSRWVYYFALAVIVVNAVLSITDEIGLADIAVLGLNLVTLALLLSTRSRYLTGEREAAEEETG